jgi:hypothetical protein
MRLVLRNPDVKEEAAGTSLERGTKIYVHKLDFCVQIRTSPQIVPLSQ